VEEWLVGFALVNTHSHGGGGVEHNMGEFFVARKYRRLDVATEAVGQILTQYPGHWEVAVAERNLVARVFWPRRPLQTFVGLFCVRVTVRIGAGQSGASERLTELSTTTFARVLLERVEAPLCGLFHAY
jgi:hypothetical protein